MKYSYGNVQIFKHDLDSLEPLQWYQKHAHCIGIQSTIIFRITDTIIEFYYELLENKFKNCSLAFMRPAIVHLLSHSSCTFGDDVAPNEISKMDSIYIIIIENSYFYSHQ
jgi:hypothetical protein